MGKEADGGERSKAMALRRSICKDVGAMSVVFPHNQFKTSTFTVKLFRKTSTFTVKFWKASNKLKF
jgi:hypothetical protein